MLSANLIEYSKFKVNSFYRGNSSINLLIELKLNYIEIVRVSKTKSQIEFNSAKQKDMKLKCCHCVSVHLL